MTRSDDLHAHLRGALHGRFKVVNLKPQQHSVSIRPVIRISDRTVVMYYPEPVQLEDNLSIRNQLLVLGASMITAAPEQALIPAAACFHVGDGNERLGTHPSKPNTTLAA